MQWHFKWQFIRFALWYIHVAKMLVRQRRGEWEPEVGRWQWWRIGQEEDDEDKGIHQTCRPPWVRLPTPGEGCGACLLDASLNALQWGTIFAPPIIPPMPLSTYPDMPFVMHILLLIHFTKMNAAHLCASLPWRSIWTCFIRLKLYLGCIIPWTPTKCEWDCRIDAYYGMFWGGASGACSPS